MDFLEKEKKIFAAILYATLMLPLVFNLNTSVQLILNSTCCVGLGAIFGIKIIKSDNKTERKEINAEDEEEEDILDMKSAMMFPIMATIGLGSLYILFKNIDKNFLNFVF